MSESHKKLKKYQYLYLLEKLSVRDYRNDLFLCEVDDKRITFYYDWLNKINKRYNYAWNNYYNRISFVDFLLCHKLNLNY